MNIDELTIRQAKEISDMSGCACTEDVKAKSTQGLADFIGMDVIIRTYSAGVWFGRLAKKSGNEVILHSARRMWRWKCNQGISLSEIAIHGIDEAGSLICEPVPMVWLEAIEIIPVLDDAAKSIKGAKYAAA